MRILLCCLLVTVFVSSAQAGGKQQVVEIPFDFYSNEIILQVNGKGPFNMMLDTGSNGAFHLTPPAVAYLGLEEQFNQAPVSTDVGYNGVSQNREGKVNNITVGAISVDAPAVIFFAKGSGRDKKPWGLNLGNAFLKDFILTIDYRNKLATLERP